VTRFSIFSVKFPFIRCLFLSLNIPANRVRASKIHFCWSKRKFMIAGLLKHHALKAYGGAEIKMYAFLILVSYGGELSSSCRDRLYPPQETTIISWEGHVPSDWRADNLVRHHYNSMEHDLRFEVYMALKIQVVIWFVTTCADIVGRRRSGGSCSPHLHPEDCGLDSSGWRQGPVVKYFENGHDQTFPRLAKIKVFPLSIFYIWFLECVGRKHICHFIICRIYSCEAYSAAEN
jgi:hypothetical protein